ncbi:hypothetical protein [Nodosilinea sp. P-1105]|uniref:hypothetical protein n=1 Tax=Nodosilinea sp. P-1105 TaxID=2546229 RepID=UPI00197E76B2|nr:hypothetical protein [Nodosilinea sp. P-1105]
MANSDSEWQSRPINMWVNADQCWLLFRLIAEDMRPGRRRQRKIEVKMPRRGAAASWS